MIYALHDPKRSIAQNEEEVPANEKWQVHENFRFNVIRTYTFRKAFVQDDMHLHALYALLDICIHFVEANSDVVDVVSKQQQLPSLNTRIRMGVSVT